MTTTTLRALLLVSTFAGLAAAQPAPSDPDCTNPCRGQPNPPAGAPGFVPAGPPTATPPLAPTTATPAPTAVGFAEPNDQPVGARPDANTQEDDGWHKPFGRRFFHGFRI